MDRFTVDDEIICEYCKDYHDTDDRPINTNQYNMCEGRFCEEMYDRYIDENPPQEIPIVEGTLNG